MGNEELSSIAESGTKSKTIAGTVLEKLRADLVSCKVRPGSKLRSNELREKYEVGISPLREALSRLAGEGLVISEDQRGFRAAPISIADFEDITGIRCDIECGALRDSIRLGDDDWESNIVRAFHHLALIKRVSGEADDGISGEWESRHRAFHRALLAGCGSERRLSMIDSLVNQSDRYRHVALAYSDMPRDDEREHKAILDAVLARDVEKAERLLIRHLTKTVDMVRVTLTQT